MQTLIDPYELAGPLNPASTASTVRARESRMTLLDVEEIEWEDHAPKSRGMRIWLSED
jgi:hypothetical protein